MDFSLETVTSTHVSEPIVNVALQPKIPPFFAAFNQVQNAGVPQMATRGRFFIITFCRSKSRACLGVCFLINRKVNSTKRAFLCPAHLPDLFLFVVGGVNSGPSHFGLHFHFSEYFFILFFLEYITLKVSFYAKVMENSQCFCKKLIKKGDFPFNK